MMSILVTGGAGFLGGSFVRQWLACEQTQVINLDALTRTGNLDSLAAELENPMHRFVAGDVADRKLLADLFDEFRPIGVVHFAARTPGGGPSHASPEDVAGTCELLDASLEYWKSLDDRARRWFKLINVSTAEVFGPPDPTSGRPRYAGESHAASAHTAAKASADHFFNVYRHRHGLPTVTTYGSPTYGPYQFPHAPVTRAIIAAMADRPDAVQPGSGCPQNWLYVEDHCRALRRVFWRGEPGARYRIWGPSWVTDHQLIQACWSAVGNGKPPHFSPATVTTQRDLGAIRSQLGWQPLVSLAHGLHYTAQWYASHVEWLKRIHTGEYRQLLKRSASGDVGSTTRSGTSSRRRAA